MPKLPKRPKSKVDPLEHLGEEDLHPRGAGYQVRGKTPEEIKK